MKCERAELIFVCCVCEFSATGHYDNLSLRQSYYFLLKCRFWHSGRPEWDVIWRRLLSFSIWSGMRMFSIDGSLDVTVFFCFYLNPLKTQNRTNPKPKPLISFIIYPIDCSVLFILLSQMSVNVLTTAGRTVKYFSATSSGDNCVSKVISDLILACTRVLPMCCTKRKSVWGHTIQYCTSPRRHGNKFHTHVAYLLLAVFAR